MNRREWLSGAAACGFLASGGCATRAGARAPPVARRIPKRIEQVGRVRIDDYAWMKPDNWLDVWRNPTVLAPDIRAHLDAENAYAASVLAEAQADRDALQAAMRARLAPARQTPPVRDGAWDYIERFAPGAEHPEFVRRPAAGGAEIVLLDSEARAEGKAYLHVGQAEHSPDHSLFAWTEDDTGAERFVLHVKNIATGEMAAAPIEGAFGDFVFSADSRFIFWTWRSAESRPTRIYRTPARGGESVLVHEETDPGMFMQLGRAASGAFVLIRIFNADMSEIRLIPAHAPEDAPIIASPRTPGHFYDIEHWDERLIIRTNAGGAVDFKLMQAPADAPGAANWREFTPHRPGAVIESVRAYRDHLVRIERVDAKLEAVVTNRGGEDRRIAFPEAAHLISLDPASAYDADRARLLYQSPRTPLRWIDVDLDSGAQRTVQEQEIPAGHDPDAYVVRRLDAPSAGGVRVPIVALMHRNTPLDGTAPLLLHGYGAYGYTTEDEFSIPNVALADRGWIVATAHVRGGGERGRAWYEDARQTRKQNTFLDFNACAEFLIAQRFAHPAKIVSYGFSAGGLTVGASANLRPDLYAGIIARAPYVDCLNTMSDATHPLVPLARPDWGDPLADPVAYDAIASYSPYENVRRQPYPAILATTAVADDRVGFWEPAKWIANLRAHSSSGRPVLLQTAASGGHVGASGRYGALDEAAALYAFAIWAVRD